MQRLEAVIRQMLFSQINPFPCHFNLLWLWRTTPPMLALCAPIVVFQGRLCAKIAILITKDVMLRRSNFLACFRCAAACCSRATVANLQR
jgi:hypothetical protein